MQIRCPECGWSESEALSGLENVWYPRGTKSRYEKRRCMECGHDFWVEGWKVKAIDNPYNYYETLYEVVDRSVVEGLRRKYGDALPSSSQLATYWIGGGGG
jgi:hypothetical protein